MSTRYARGTHALGECARSGRKMLLRDMVRDGYYPHLLVDPAWRDPPHPQEKLPTVSDPETLRFPAPENIESPTAPVLSAAPYENLVENNGFEIGDLTGWLEGGSGGAVVVDDFARSGNYSLRAAANGAQQLYRPPDQFDATPGQIYYASGYAMRDEFDDVPDVNARVDIIFLDSGLSTLDTQHAAFDAATSGWQQATVTATAPTGTAYVRVRFNLPAGNDGAWFFDDLIFYPLSKLTNGGFEEGDLTGWSSVYNNGTVSNSMPRTGTYSLRVAAIGDYVGQMQNFPASEGEVWYGEVYGARDEASLPDVNAFVQISFLDSLGVAITNVASSFDRNTSGWQLKTVQDVAPAGTVTVRFRFFIDQSQSAGAWFFDDAQFRRGGAALGWTEAETKVSMIFKYEVWRSDDDGVTFSLIETVDVERDSYAAITNDPLSYDDPGVIGDDFQYYVIAYPYEGPPAQSNTIVVSA